MKDIQCTNPNCRKIILYQDYCLELRAVNFKGIHCTHCGAEQLLKYSWLNGDGKIRRVRYESPGKTKYVKIQTYRSCPKCKIFWGESPELHCPACGAFVGDEFEIVKLSIKGVRNIPEGLDKEQRKLQLKLDFLIIDSRKFLTESFSAEQKLSLEQQDIIHKFCKLEIKGVNKS
jgi:hypothetical protein